MQLLCRRAALSISSYTKVSVYLKFGLTFQTCVTAILGFDLSLCKPLQVGWTLHLDCDVEAEKKLPPFDVTFFSPPCLNVSSQVRILIEVKVERPTRSCLAPF